MADASMVRAGGRAAQAAATVLIAVDDPSVRTFLKLLLEFEGFTVESVADGRAALNVVQQTAPELVILDLSVPFIDGIEVCRAIRLNPRTRNVSVIMVAARGGASDRLEAFGAGADDYVAKPFDPPELVARARVAVDRSRAMRSVNPLTQLPGNVRLQLHLEDVIAASVPFALLYIDLDHFKAYNDHYGFLRGDDALRLMARATEDAVEAQGGGFVGHVGGDDFVVIVDANKGEAVAQDIIESWDASVGALYNPEDVARGYIEVVDRRGELQRFPIMAISIGIATNLFRDIAAVGEAVTIATEMKGVAKRNPTSSFAMDRRVE
ncbi:MAG: response regulator [Actinomycetota bacterium]